jgi:hypothetical protein
MAMNRICQGRITKVEIPNGNGAAKRSAMALRSAVNVNRPHMLGSLTQRNFCCLLH